ncbi:MAG: rhamnulose-1-phosphate aldolase [Bacteroidales bacterium]|nr:rhamnulose-1-phosphate aldolase [Candidatus Cacconaster merdequi]
MLMYNDIFNDILEQVSEISGHLWNYGWAERNGGNISYNITGCASLFCERPALGTPRPIGFKVPELAGAYFLVTGTGKRMRYVSKSPLDNAAVIRICPDLEHYEIVAEKEIFPSSELPSHLAIHNFLQVDRPSYKAVLHTHPIELIAMTHNRAFLEKDVLTKILWSMIPETRAFCPKGLGVVRYVLPGSVALAEATLEQLKEYDVVLWEKHGVVAVGEDLVEAFDMLDTLSKSAKIYESACSMGFVPEGMSDAQMNELKEAFNL